MKKIIILGLISGIILGWYGCQKDDIILNKTNNHKTPKLNAKVGNDTTTYTVLGQQRNNPYTLAKMTEAWNNIYSVNQITQLDATDVYIKFTPADFEEVKALQESDLILFDYPLDYEVIKMGDRYIPPGMTEMDMPVFYSVVKPEMDLSAFTHEVLADLFLAPYNTDITKEAFRLTSNTHDKVVKDWDTPDGITPPCTEDCPNWPDCLDFGVPCEDEDTSSGNTSGSGDTGGGKDPNTDPDEPTPGNPGEVTVTTGPTLVMNDCGCEVYADAKKPGGCVNVNDTQLGLRGIRNVRVIIKDGWFDFYTIQTDHHGCFKLNKKLNKIKMWVEFNSERVNIRGIRLKLSPLAYLIPVKDYVDKFKDNLNQIEVNYGHDTDIKSKALRYWMAATANNSLYEFDDMAIAEGVGIPPQQLEVLVTNQSSNGAAPMIDKINNQDIIATLGLPNILEAFLENTFDFFEVFDVLPPDVIIGYDKEESKLKSDQINTTIYHEYAHAAHFAAAGEDLWLSNIEHILEVKDFKKGGATMGTYGDGNQDGSDLCALIETWGEHIGKTYTDKTYGLMHSNSIIPLEMERTRHFYELERQDFWDVGFLYIPEGILHDLVDDNANNPQSDNPLTTILWDFYEVTDETTGDKTKVIIPDEVKGFNNAQFFGLLDPDMQSMEQFRDDLETIFLPISGNTQEDFDALFNIYEID